MTPAELNRFFKSKARVRKAQQQERASFDYILADLIGRSVARVYNSSNKLPNIAEAYPSLFASEEIEAQIQARRNELSVARFKQYAQSYMSKYKGV